VWSVEVPICLRLGEVRGSGSGLAVVPCGLVNVLSGSSSQRDRPNLVPAVSSSPHPPTRPSGATRRCARICSSAAQPARSPGRLVTRSRRSTRSCAISAPAAASLFVSSRPGPKRAPAKERAHARIVELRAAGHSIDEIALALKREGMALNRTGIAEVIAEEGFGRLWRRPQALRGAPRREQLSRTDVIDFDQWPERVPAKHAGLLLCMPDLVALDLPAIVTAAGYPGTSVIPAVSSILSLLALKLASIRRVSHVEDLATDPGAALFSGLSSLPKTTALTSYSYKLSHERQHAFLVALNKAMVRAGLIQGADFDLDFTRSCTGARTLRSRNTTFPAARSGPGRCSPSSPRTPAPTT
jgi:hypothetical protein